MCILNTEGCNIFENLSSEEYSEALDLLRNNILATDLASHFRSADEQRMLTSEGYDKSNRKHQKILHAMFMTCCDLNDQTKNWRVSKQTAVIFLIQIVYNYFPHSGSKARTFGPRRNEQSSAKMFTLLPLWKNIILSTTMSGVRHHF